MSKISEQIAAGSASLPDRQATGGEIFIIQSPAEERIQRYKSIVREELAKNKSVFMPADCRRHGKNRP